MSVTVEEFQRHKEGRPIRRALFFFFLLVRRGKVEPVQEDL